MGKATACAAALQFEWFERRAREKKQWEERRWGV
jgi:hypothetical protein